MPFRLREINLTRGLFEGRAKTLENGTVGPRQSRA